MRTIVDIPEPSLQALDELARLRGQSRAAAVRSAVDSYVEANRAEMRRAKLEDLFDRIKPGEFGEDGVVYQQRIRAEWDRD